MSNDRPKPLTDAQRERYARQIRLPQIGEDGQRRLLASRAVIIGCGALGSNAAERLSRAGVGLLKLVDRDIVEWSNLPRQSLFTEADAQAQTPKAVALASAIAAINQDCTCDAVPAHVDAANIEELIAGADCVVDGCDNFATRYLINDACVKHGIPWVYAGVLATEGVSMPILPGQTPCLRCLFESPPPPETVDTCDSAGVLGSAVGFVSALQTTDVLKILLGEHSSVSRKLTRFDLWRNRIQSMDVSEGRRADCPCCGLGQYDFLTSQRHSQLTSLCGSNTIQILPPAGQSLDLVRLAERLPQELVSVCSELYLRLDLDQAGVTIFSDGRALIRNARDANHARSLYTRLIGD
jgi:adenylyltransferase/sulfurtransferase